MRGRPQHQRVPGRCGEATRCGREAGRRTRHGWLTPLGLVILGLIGPGPGLSVVTPASAQQLPGRESFAREPRNPLEAWEAIDYLVRTRQGRQAVPYLEKLLKEPLDDATLVEIRDRFGIGSILRLGDDPATRRFAQPIADRLLVASRRFATEPVRINKAVAALDKSKEEQALAVARLRAAGPDAVPATVKALEDPATAPESRAAIARNLGRLDLSAVPPLLAVLDSPDERLAADAATALGSIGDQRALPFLTYHAASGDVPAQVGLAAREAVARLTGRPFAAQPRPPIRVLTDAAWGLHRRLAEFPGERVLIWDWDMEQKLPVPREVTRDQAEETLGLRLARWALKLDPRDREARAAELSLKLERAIDRAGYADFPTKDKAAFDAAVAAGAELLDEVLSRAVADRKVELAAIAAAARAKVTDPSTLGGGPTHPLVEALASPGRRLQFAAARALVELAPTQAFPGSSRVVPTLARFAASQGRPRAVIIDGNAPRGSQLAGSASGIGYDTTLELRGDRGFLAAAESTDVELVLVGSDVFQGAWDLADTLSNLHADPRTANLPVYVYGPRNLELYRPHLTSNFPGVKFLVRPLDAPTLEKLLGGRPSNLTEADRATFAREAVASLAKIAAQPQSPFAPELPEAEPVLTRALRLPDTAVDAANALGEIPGVDAQRSLADVLLDPARPVDLRRKDAAALERNIRRYGAVVSADQIGRLAAESMSEADPGLKQSLASVIRALRARSPQATRVRSAAPGTVPSPVQP